MLGQPRVAFVAGALSVAILWGFTRWAPSFEAHESGHSNPPLAADSGIAATSAPGFVPPVIRYHDASRSDAHGIWDEGTTLRLPADGSAMRGMSSQQVSQNSDREGFTQPHRKTEAAPSAASSAEHGFAGTTAADDVARATRSDTASGSDANLGLGHEITVLQLAADRSVVIRRAPNETSQADHGDPATQTPVPADAASSTASNTTPSAPPSTGSGDASRAGGQHYASGGSEAPVAAQASHEPPAATPLGNLRADPFISEAPDISLGGPVDVGSASGGSHTEIFVWHAESTIGPEDLPGRSVSNRPDQVGGGIPASMGNASTGDIGNGKPDLGLSRQNAIGFEPLNPSDIAAVGKSSADTGTAPGVGSPPPSGRPLLQFAVIPEPGTAGLLASGIVGLAMLRRRASAGSRRG